MGWNSTTNRYRFNFSFKPLLLCFLAARINLDYCLPLDVRDEISNFPLKTGDSASCLRKYLALQHIVWDAIQFPSKKADSLSKSRTKKHEALTSLMEISLIPFMFGVPIQHPPIHLGMNHETFPSPTLQVPWDLHGTLAWEGCWIHGTTSWGVDRCLVPDVKVVEGKFPEQK